MSVSVRLATENDLDICALIRTASIACQPATLWSAQMLLQAAAYYDSAKIAAVFALPTSAFWVAKHNGIIRAFGGVKENYLHFLFVHPHAQGQGLGSRLIGIAEDYVRQQGAEFIWLEAHPYAEPFYQRHHYRFKEKTIAPFGGAIAVYQKTL